MGRIIIFIYGVVAYLAFFVTVLYAIGFVGNFAVQKSIDSGIEASLGRALIIDIGLFALFAVQHSVMARRQFKKWWTKIIPEPAERSTYVLSSCLLFVLIFHLWHPIPDVVWDVENPIGYFTLSGLFWIGWAIITFSTFLTGHFDLLGLRQVYLHLRNRAYTPLEFKTPSLYKLVRHPMYLGTILAFWATPRMTVGHLVFAIANTLYILVGIQFEERDLISDFGQAYENYRKQVPMLLPLPGKTNVSDRY